MKNETTPALLLVEKERLRQIDEEGYKLNDDLKYNTNRLLLLAAMAYLFICIYNLPALAKHLIWPWSKERFKPSGLKRNLIKALALGIAALDRILLEEKTK